MDVVHAFQNGMKFGTLEQWNSSEGIPSATQDYAHSGGNSQKIVENLSDQEFLQRLSDLMVKNSPAPVDKPIVDAMSAVRISAGKRIFRHLQMIFSRHVSVQRIG